MDPFVEFGLQGFDTELKGINSFIKSKLNRLVYRSTLTWPFVRTVYRVVTPRTFVRELTRLAELGFIVFERDTAAGESVVGFDFGAIGRYGPT